MKLDRNIEGNNGKGKYALILLRHLQLENPTDVKEIAHQLHEQARPSIDLGLRHSDSEFFVIRLKDKYAAAALEAYANAAQEDDAEFAGQVYMMAERAKRHPARKQPD